MSLLDISRPATRGSSELAPSRYGLQVGHIDVMVISDGVSRWRRPIFRSRPCAMWRLPATRFGGFRRLGATEGFWFAP